MPHRPPGLTYREALDGLREVQRILRLVLQAELTSVVRLQIRTLAKDDGRRR